ncbi:metal-dependent hydrolase [Hazenella sp. IB182357]|uniref:Metal-dependent hydrolase n=1 Tax=Polycladospora coralii TaxID=2771432 RepID=A0A926NHD8_9BACL|nr:metal-dependent hydrolase [Polycladospora coralii]MBD1373368.1 metal-dependent hydrolase [Polycladospora coralii]
MDTGTHFVMGASLFGLAHLDPTVISNPDTTQAVLFATVVGSQLPDFDTIYRLFGNTIYIKKHRGFSHSLPMTLIWPTLLTLALLFFFTDANLIHVWLWSWISVVIHVSIDCFNTYGTQAARPFSSKWIAWDIIHIFDPFIATILILGLSLWNLFHLDPGLLFLCLFAIILLYIIRKVWIHHKLLNWIKKKHPYSLRYKVSPTIRGRVWNVIVEDETVVKVGEVRGKNLLWTGHVSKKALHHPATLHSQSAESIAAFLSFTSYGYPQVLEIAHGYEVRWLDVRYHYKKNFPFIAVAILDRDYQLQYDFVGWMSDEQRQKKIKSYLTENHLD